MRELIRSLHMPAHAYICALCAGTQPNGNGTPEASKRYTALPSAETP